MIAVREFTSTAEMRAHAVAVHARCFNSKARPVLALPAPVVAFKPKPSMIREAKPLWMRKHTHFDTHVVESRRILELLKTGEIEFPKCDKRTILTIVTEVLQRFPGVTIPQVKGPTRHRDIVAARQAAMYAVRQERQDLSFPAIGRWFGGRDHTTVLHAVRKVEAAREPA